MSGVALGLYVVALVVLFGLRSVLQRRRTGASGFVGVTGKPGELGWWGGVLFVLAMVLGLTGPLLAVLGVATTAPPAVVAGVGLGLALIGFLAALAAQLGMGASWRIGVDEADRTELVTTGVFAYVRNPFFTALTAAQLGIVLLTPNPASVAALLALVAAVQLQVRFVEEPYLAAVHRESYAEYAAHSGRFVPGLGRLRPFGPMTAIR